MLNLLDISVYEKCAINVAKLNTNTDHMRVFTCQARRTLKGLMM